MQSPATRLPSNPLIHAAKERHLPTRCIAVMHYKILQCICLRPAVCTDVPSYRTASSPHLLACAPSSAPCSPTAISAPTPPRPLHYAIHANRAHKPCERLLVA